MAGRKIRVLLAARGTDANDRDAMAVALALRNAGMEVIYTGAYRAVEQVAAVALQEDVDVVALGVPPGDCLSPARRLLETLDALDIRKDLKVAVGGAISARDASRLREMGVDGIIPAGTRPEEVAAWFGGLGKKGRPTGRKA